MMMGNNMKQLVLEYEGTIPLKTSIDRAIQREIAVLALAIRLSQEALQTFESHYGMPSEEFFEKMERGELGDSDDFIEWAGEYELLQRTQHELDALEQIRICS
jgi:hypothetical protein